MATVVIVGGGYAGLAAAHRLRRHLGAAASIVLVDPAPRSVARPMLPEVAVGGLAVETASFSLERALARARVEFVQAAVTRVDFERHRITLADGSQLAYDRVLLNPGAVHDFAAIPGMDAWGQSVCDEEHALRLNAALESFTGGRILVGSAPFRQGTAVKAPHLDAACEGPVGEVLFMLDTLVRARGLREQVEITAFSPADRFFDDVGDSVHRGLDPLFAERGIGLVTGRRLVGLEAGRALFEEGDPLPFDLAIIIPGYRGHDFIVASGLADEAGFIPTDITMRHVAHPDVFAAGDAASLSVPKLGHIAVMQAEIAADAIARDLEAPVLVPPYRPEVFCIMGMGPHEAAMMRSDVLFGGDTDLVVRGPIPHFLKESLDRYYVHHEGHMPPAFMEWVLDRLMALRA